MSAHANAMGGLGDLTATQGQRSAAAFLCVPLVIFTALAIVFGLGQGPEVKPLLPITATMWSLADLLTGFLLLGQFYVNGRVSLAILAAAYAFGGLLTWPFLFTFPGVFAWPPYTFGEQSQFVYFWMVWHVAFPVLVIASMHGRFALYRIASRQTIRVATVATALLPLLATAATAVTIFAAREALPHLVIGGHLQPLDRLVFHPAIVVLNVAACFTLLCRRERMTALQLWLCVAMFSASLDSLLVNLSAKIYSYAWDTGKIINVFTATIVLVMILIEIVRLYGEQLRHNEKLERDLVARNRVEAALRASEERFRQVEEHAPIGLALIDLDGRFTRVNPALCRLTGYDEDELLSTRLQALTHPDDLAQNLSYMEQAIEGVVESYQMEKRYLHRDGHVVWVLVHGSIVRGVDGGPGYLIAQIADISPRKAAEKAIEDAQVSVLAAAEAKSRFLATMSHEIRTPMNGIIGMTELLSLSDLNREQNEFVQVVWDSGRSLLRVLDDILDYSKIEAGKLELEHLDFDLPSQVRSVVALMRPQYEVKGVSLTTQVEADVAVSVIGDPGRVRQVLINLVGNALKFTPAGGSVGIVMSAEPSDDGHRAVRFTVVDTGVGVAPEMRPRLFQPFSQADGSTTRKYGGTGLGLSICKQLVDLMGGRIDVTSDARCGSSFWFTIPFLRGTTINRVLDAPAREMGERRAAIPLRPEKLLVAEDNEVNTLLALKQFKQLGFEVTVASNGREAVDAYERGRFDLVFMDCHMPVVDGFEATKTIRNLPADAARRVPIVALTANASAVDREACFAAGMDDYVAKPVSLVALQTVLARWLP